MQACHAERSEGSSSPDWIVRPDQRCFAALSMTGWDGWSGWWNTEIRAVI